jgi:hypothetical protein
VTYQERSQISANFLARAAASQAMAGLFFVFIHLLTGAYPPLVIGSVYLVLGPGLYVVLFGTLFVIDACLFCLNVFNLFL